MGTIAAQTQTSTNMASKGAWLRTLTDIRQTSGSSNQSSSPKRRSFQEPSKTIDVVHACVPSTSPTKAKYDASVAGIRSGPWVKVGPPPAPQPPAPPARRLPRDLTPAANYNFDAWCKAYMGYK